MQILDCLRGPRIEKEIFAAETELKTALYPLIVYVNKNPSWVLGSIGPKLNIENHGEGIFYYGDRQNLDLNITERPSRASTQKDILWFSIDGTIHSISRSIQADAGTQVSSRELKGKERLATIKKFTNYLQEYNSGH
jgi:hypothetical protein